MIDGRELSALRQFLALFFERAGEFSGEFRSFVEVIFARQFLGDHVGRSVGAFSNHEPSNWTFNEHHTRSSKRRLRPIEGVL